MNEQEFRGKVLLLNYWDGKENFKNNIESKEVEEKRLDEFGEWLE